MDVVTDPPDMRAWTAAHRRAGKTIGCVPTMGALHAGHLALVEEARRHCDVVVMTIFVNPLQFNRTDDFNAYPRPIDDDLQAARQAGVDAVYAPTAATMYPPGYDTFVEVGMLAAPMEGAGRPGHFRGMATVVLKLLSATDPDVAVFGEKDFQQLAIIRRMVNDFDLGVRIVGAPTVREADGLAMSSRNRRLTPDERAAAVAVPRSLQAARALFASGERRASVLEAAAREVVAAEPLARLEYVGLADIATLQPVSLIERPTVIATAVWFGDVRLIDNVTLLP